jgi:hypothetical protein
MMKIRDRRATAYFLDSDTGAVTADVVLDNEDARIDTGLLDSRGNPIYRARPKIGFGK